MKKILLIISVLVMSNLVSASELIVDSNKILGHKMSNLKGETISISKDGSIVLFAESQRIVGKLVENENAPGAFSVEGDQIPLHSLQLRAISLDEETANTDEAKSILGKVVHTVIVITSALDAEGRQIRLAE